MSGFGDVEPEDAWHPDDPTPLLLDNLARRAALLEQLRTVPPTGGDPVEILDDLAAILAAARRRRLIGRELVRADQLGADIAHLRHRLED